MRWRCDDRNGCCEERWNGSIGREKGVGEGLSEVV
jgi:hypothetical protein